MTAGRLPLWAAAPSWPSATAAAPMSYLATSGAAADPATRLGWGVMLVGIVVMVIVGGLLLGALLRRRPAPPNGDERALVARGGGLAWISVGTGLSTVALVVVAIWMLTVLAAVGRPAQPAALRIQVTAHQWWWEVRYPGDDGFVTANEIHIPVGAPVDVALVSDDVIHSFWIPKLGGKMDVVPGQTNVTWLQADAPGVYRGQCGEFCGAQHAQMAMLMVAAAPAEFEAWREGQRAAATSSESDGRRLFESHCGLCHVIRGVTEGGVVGPDLTHLMSRHTLVAGMLRNTEADLARWIADPQGIKPGSLMPRLDLSDADRVRIVAYLRTLH